MKSGILIIDKEKGKTSRDIVNEVCRKFGTKKVGHTGTLDPLATGVLVLAINDGCRIISFLESDEKEYVAEVVTGTLTDTLDVTGSIIDDATKEVTKEEVERVLLSFLGTYEQEVPKFSAVHVDGKRLYEYARSGEEVTLPKRMVAIKEIELLSFEKEEEHFIFSFRVVVSKGTYIRSLIRDIGERLDVFCTMQNLRRTRQGIFRIEDAKMVEKVNADDILPISFALSNFPKKKVGCEETGFVQNGRKLMGKLDKPTCIVDEDGEILAIYENAKEEGYIKPIKVFMKH